MSVCMMCSKRVKDWEGDDPKCSFPNGVFDSVGWNCATANAVRDIAEKNQLYFGDQKIALLNADAVGSLCLFVTWYKSRGRTEGMWLMSDYDTPRKPLESEILEILKHYEVEGLGK